MASGMALSVTGAPSGFLEMTNLQANPLSFTIWSPKNSASLLAVEMEVDFWAPYSSNVRDMERFSEIRPNNSESGMFDPAAYAGGDIEIIPTVCQ